MNLTNMLNPRSIFTVAVTSSVIGFGLFHASEALAGSYSFGLGGDPWTSTSIQPNGVAEAVDNNASIPVMRLVPDAMTGQVGSVFLNKPQHFGANTDIDSTFTFQITSNQGSLGPGLSDGLAFVIGTSPVALGGGGGSLGYGGATGGTPISPSIVVEFDIHQNSWDPSASHVAITTNGDEQNFLNFTNTIGSMSNEHVWQAHIQYQGLSDLLTVTLKDLNVPNSTVSTQANNINILEQLCRFSSCSTLDDVYFGITAATGDGYANHDILTWSISVPEPTTLALMTVGLACMSFGTRRKQAG